MPDDPTVMNRIYGQAIEKIIEAVSPFIDIPEVTRPLPVKFANKTPQSIHIQLSIDRGTLNIEFLLRQKNPDEETLVIPPGDERVVDLTKR